MPTASHPQELGTKRKTDPAAKAPAPTSHGLGTHPSVWVRDLRGSRKAAMIATMQTTAAVANCGIDATKRSCLISKAVDAPAAIANKAPVTESPILPSQGVVVRSGTSASTSAIEVEMLHTVCNVST